MRKFYIVWNEAKTEGFVTTDYQVAYEARKGSESNCYYPDGTRSDLAMDFCNHYADENCTIEEIT